MLVADSSNEVDLLSREEILLALPEHVRVSDMEAIEHTVGVDSQHLLLLVVLHEIIDDVNDPVLLIAIYVVNHTNKKASHT